MEEINEIEIDEEDREMAAAIRHALYRSVPNMPSYPAGIIEPYLALHRMRRHVVSHDEREK